MSNDGFRIGERRVMDMKLPTLLPSFYTDGDGGKYFVQGKKFPASVAALYVALKRIIFFLGPWRRLIFSVF